LRACQPKVIARRSKAIRKADLDDNVLLGVMFLLGRDAERLGIADDPDLRSDW
jgi:hypothetical protein